MTMAYVRVPGVLSRGEPDGNYSSVKRFPMNEVALLESRQSLDSVCTITSITKHSAGSSILALSTFLRMRGGESLLLQMRGRVRRNSSTLVKKTLVNVRSLITSLSIDPD